MTDRESKLQEIKLILLNNLKKKIEAIEDNTENKDKKKISDPLAGMKTVVKHFGLQNRLK